MNHHCGPGECVDERCPARRLSTRAGALLLPEELARFLVSAEGRPEAWRLTLYRRCPTCPVLGTSLVGIHDVKDHEPLFEACGPTVNSTVVRFRRMLEGTR